MENENCRAVSESFAMKEGEDPCSYSQNFSSQTKLPFDSRMKNDDNFTKALPLSYAMKGGEGPHSYARNSNIQRVAIEKTKKFLFEGIFKNFDPMAHFPSSSTNPIRIADLGCSTGPNTFIAMQYITEAIELKYKSQGLKIPEFQVFFNDRVSNDFNTLFKTLPPNRNYFAVGVPGSFCGRLFPKQSLHFVHSSSTLSWISKIPEEIIDKNSSAFNKGRIHYTDASKEVKDAYGKQHQEDIENFLNARAQEIVANGLMAIQMATAHDVIEEFDIYPGKELELLGTCLVDMAKVGLVSEEKVDSFNLPIFFSPLENVKETLERNENFTIEGMEILDSQYMSLPTVEMYVMHRRAAFEGLIESHFGGEIVDELFDRFTRKLVDFPDIMNRGMRKFVVIFVLLKRKPCP